jgi:hypothetical protein
MSQKTKARKSTLLVAASATGAVVGFLTVPVPAQATPMFPLAPPGCNQFEFPGGVNILEVGTGWSVAFDATGKTLNARVTAKHPGETKLGTITGGFTNVSHVDMTVNYDNGQSQRYIGDVDFNDNRKLAGQTASGVFWRTQFPIMCGEVVPQANPGAPSKTGFITTPPEYDEVDVYDVPDGVGKVVGTVAKDKGVQVNADCQPDTWCLIRGVAVPTGQGWIWGHLRFE